MKKTLLGEEKKNLIVVAENFIQETINLLRNRYEINHIGLAVPGTIRKGVILRSVNLQVTNYDIAKSLKEKLGVEILVRNDAKCAAIAEYKYGKNRNKKNMLFITLGTGIGGAFIYDDKLLTGSCYEGYEFGHMVIKENGIKCNCGKAGCFEKYGSILCFKRKCIERLGLSYNISGPELRTTIDGRKKEIEDIICEYVKDLALGISNLINIFEPDITVIGGGFARYDYMLLEPLKEEIFQGNLLFNKREDIDIYVASLGNDAGMIGAIW